MNDKEPTLPDQFRMKFPHLRPIKNPPRLTTVNGIGIGMYGKRDFDEETGTYIKTRCLCIVFIPVFAIDAYRVADADSRSWYFLGKESVSSFARSWNIAVAGMVALLALSLTWKAHTSSPEYLARKDLERAAAFQQSNRPLDAAKIFRGQLTGPRAADARTGLAGALNECFNSTDAGVIAQGYRLMDGLTRDFKEPALLVPDAVNRGIAFAEKIRGTNPDGALEVLGAMTPIAPDNAAVSQMKVSILKQLVLANPGETNRVIELALVYESVGQMEDCWNLLRPYQQQLGATEGARILGRKLLDDGQYDDAYALLFPYVQTRLDRLRTIESAYTNAVATVSSRAIDDLREGRAPKDFYAGYEQATELHKQEMVDRFIQARMDKDARVQRALEQLQDANQIVHVALELGIVQLNRAQNLGEPGARKAELEAAEKTFLAIRGFAGDTDEYKMFLGQVYYWLGRSGEGKQLFDELLIARKRAFPILMALANTLRAVGEINHGRQLTEEAYTNASSNEEKFAAASSRALMFTDEDDQVAWLEKADPASSWTQIQLNNARGRVALKNEDKPKAAEYFRKAIRAYDSQPRNSASLNNCALVCFNLHSITGEAAEFNRGLEMMEQAIAMEPGDSILLQNSATLLLTHALKNVIGDAIRLDAVREHPNFGTLTHLYRNDHERSQVYQQLRQNGAFRRSIAYLDKALLLAPKKDDLYPLALMIHTAFRDLPEMQKLEQRVRISNPDFSEARNATLAVYRGEKDAVYREQASNRARQLKDLAASPAVRDHAPTLVEANVQLFNNRWQEWVFGGEMDLEELFQLATESSRLEQSAATRSMLQIMHLARASRELETMDPAYAALSKNTRRALSHEEIFTLLLDRGGPMANRIRSNKHFGLAMEIEREILAAYENWVNPGQWALLRSVDSEAAARIAAQLRTNETARLATRLKYEFNSADATAVLEEYWMHRLLGQDQRAEDIYRTALKDGIPLPPL